MFNEICEKYLKQMFKRNEWFEANERTAIRLWQNISPKLNVCVCFNRQNHVSSIYVQLKLQLVFNTVNNFNLCFSYIKLVVYQVFGHAELCIKSKMTYIWWFGFIFGHRNRLRLLYHSFVLWFCTGCLWELNSNLCIFPSTWTRCRRQHVFQADAVYGFVGFRRFHSWNIVWSFKWFTRLARIVVWNKCNPIAS